MDKKVEWSETVQLGTTKKGKDTITIHPLFSNTSVFIEDFSKILRAVKVEDFLQKFSDNFMGLRLDIEQTIEGSIITNKEELSLDRIFLGASKSEFSLTFVNGKIKYTKDNIDSIATISSIWFQGDTIQVVVDGDAQLAEETLKRIAIFMYDQASLKRSWPEIQKSIYVKNWRIGVEVDLKLSTIELIHPSLRKILDDEINTNIEHFGDMLFGKDSKMIKHNKKAIIDPEIKFNIGLVDLVSGYTDLKIFEIDRQKSYQRGTNKMRIVANCDFETLENLLLRISKELKK